MAVSDIAMGKDDHQQEKEGVVQRYVSFEDSDSNRKKENQQEQPPPSPASEFSDISSHDDCKPKSYSPPSSEKYVEILLPQLKRFSSKSLRSNLTREQLDRDPLFFYEVIKTLGAGSMGSVARVRKRVHVVGGSARKDIQEAVKRQQRNRQCLRIPIIGGLFRFCIDGDLTHRASRKSFSLGSSNRFSGFFQTNRELLHVDSQDSLHDSFHGGSVGSDGSRSSGRQICYAMKSIHLNRVTDSEFVSELRNEISILKQLDHPHIVRAIETFEHRNQIFIVMELCSGGDLYSRDPYTEEEAARILSSILSALAYMHSKNVVHRDLKYENILFVNDSPKAEVKLIDFGLSKVYGDNSQLTEGVGKSDSRVCSSC